jgi:hypothetical protein
MLDAGPGVTVTFTLPDTLLEVAETVPLPAVVAVKSPPCVMLPMFPVTDQVGVMDTVFSLASLPAALNCCVEPEIKVRGNEGVSVITAKGPGVTVTFAFPDTLPKVATTVPLPDDVAVKSPLAVMVPIPPVTDQDGVRFITLLLVSLTTAVN